MEPGSDPGGNIYPDAIPLVPPSVHPEWQGSISSKWMDRMNGHERGLKPVRTYCRNGHDGIARQGLGAFFTDPTGNLYNEGRRRVPFPEDGAETWPEREVVWRPSRRVSCVPPNSLFKDQITAKEKLTDHLYVRRYEAAERFRMRGLLKAASQGLLAQHSGTWAAEGGLQKNPHQGPTCTESIKFGSPRQQRPEPLVSTVEGLKPHHHGFTTRYAGPPALKGGNAGDGGSFELQELPTRYKHPNFWSQGPAVPPSVQLFPESHQHVHAHAPGGLKKSASAKAGLSLNPRELRELQMVKEAEEWELRKGVASAELRQERERNLSRNLASGAAGTQAGAIANRTGIPVPSALSMTVG